MDEFIHLFEDKAHKLCKKKISLIEKAYAFSCWGIFRTHGRITPYLSHPCHVELIVTEKQEDVKKGDGKKAVKLTKKQAARKRLAIGSVNQCSI